MLIGSRAAKHWFSDFREPKDTDYMSDESIEGAEVKFCPSYKLAIEKYKTEIAPPELLYSLKFSHAFWDIHWNKTIFDISFFQQKGIKLDEELLPLLYKDCEARYGKKKSYLNVSNDKFFDDKVERVYIHDDIHRAIAFYKEPLFEKIKENKEKALTSRKMFDSLNLDDKLKLCREEIYVTALERELIPNNFERDIQGAYRVAIKKLITQMTSGWFPRFILENWQELKRIDINYVEKFKQNIEKYGLRQT